jgi:hypothetical protein
MITTTGTYSHEIAQAAIAALVQSLRARTSLLYLHIARIHPQITEGVTGGYKFMPTLNETQVH